LFKVVTDFDDVTFDVLQTFRVNWERSWSQREDVSWSPNFCSPLGNRDSLNQITLPEFWSEVLK